ncbi:MAG: hypothetical protein J5950_08545 [Clostridia bacterium]|nr:hypothetical protein [Clostridia bacterium]
MKTAFEIISVLGFKWAYAIFGILGILFVVFVILSIIRAIANWKTKITDGLLGGIRMSDLKQAFQDGSKEAENPTQRTLFGATSIYLPRILNDFPDFHMPEAKNAVSLLLTEYLKIRFGEIEEFENSNVENDLVAMIPRSQTPAEVTDINFHDCAVRNYLKTKEYATITYIATVGYTAGGRRSEDRYQIDSTLKLSEEGIPKKLMICTQCGGAIDTTAHKYCPYCGSGIVWDTKLSWRFTAIREC